MDWVKFLSFFVFVFFARSYYAWRVVPAHQNSYALRAKDTGNEMVAAIASMLGGSNVTTENPELLQPQNTLHTTYKFGWCKPDAIQHSFLFREANYTVRTTKDADTQWIYVLDSENNRRFNLQCTIVKVYVRAQDAFKRTRIPFHYCQGSVYYLMLRTVGRMMIHEFYFMTKFYMPATFVFEYYHPQVV